MVYCYENTIVSWAANCLQFIHCLETQLKIMSILTQMAMTFLPFFRHLKKKNQLYQSQLYFYTVVI